MAIGSTLPRRALGRRLRELRFKSKKSQLAAGLAIEVSKQGIGRLEEGQPVRISTAQFRDLLDFYGADEGVRDEVLGLLQEVKAAKGDPSRGWWRAYADVVNPHFDHFMSLEQACSRMTAFQLTLLPGLLQTAEYRRWLVLTENPGISQVDIDRRLELMVRRQRRITETPGLTVDVLLSEAVLRHQVGGRHVMESQVRRLVELGRLPNVSVRVIPFGVGGHSGLIVQSFTLFEFPALRAGRTPEPPVVFVEGFTGALFMEDTGSIERHRQASVDLHGVALSADDSERLMQEIAEEYAA
ncbi:helix-turn-helix domain-containing protein [Nocardia flavorosea]|uniref:helix-turn-helix domain-containing protein n=1 Tax=Nocardia flavorosea TaxID=53429 RepID=UPI001894DC5B|nr:helix-turn-helix transcriptional regulator [Nocardia flavorosea]MBF6349010.1 helix-turn-helix domain-containing protein [Nocardia flavorosea]